MRPESPQPVSPGPRLAGVGCARNLGKAARPSRLPSWPAATRTWSDLAPSTKWKYGMTPIAAALGEWLAPAIPTCDSPTSRWRTDPGEPPRPLTRFTCGKHDRDAAGGLIPRLPSEVEPGLPPGQPGRKILCGP